jgi:hypothetical protein
MPDSAMAKTKHYTVSKQSKAKIGYRKCDSYNKYTKDYFVIRTYLEKLEAAKGGTLTIKKGTYTITNSLYVPNNVTVKFEDGVKIIKGNKTGKAVLKPAESIFQIVTKKNAQKKKSAKGYNACRNVKFIGSGNVVIDLKYIKEAKGILMAHCQNIEISGITFKNMNVGHFLEVDATKNIRIHDCTFSGVKASTPYTKEAINLDTPDAITHGLGSSWSKPDKLPNVNVTIENCAFANLKRGIGTHKYSQKKKNGVWAINMYHENVVIRNNTFTNIQNMGIFMLNWKNVTIDGNVFVNNTQCLDFRGVQQPVSITGNSFNDNTVVRTFRGDNELIYFMGYKSPGPGNVYSPIYNNLGFTTLSELLEMNEN